MRGRIEIKSLEEGLKDFRATCFRHRVPHRRVTAARLSRWRASEASRRKAWGVAGWIGAKRAKW
jgi:hypothetical protein